MSYNVYIRFLLGGVIMNKTISLIQNHKSIRKFLDKPIDEVLINEILKCARASSTSSFMQAYTIIRVNEIEKRKFLAKLSGEQSYVEECALFLVFCADLHKHEIACQINNAKMSEGYTETFIIATVDASLAAQNALLAAESLGLGGVYIGGIRNNPEEISSLLELPNNVYPVFGMCIGYPDESPDLKPRLPLKVVCCEDKYDLDQKIDLIKQYDEEISKYYFQRTNGAKSHTWTELMANHTNKPLRPHMKQFLVDKGFLKK
jgi:nitroreductase